MKQVIELNRELPGSGKDDLDVVISELVEREEFSCTGNGCGVAACGVNTV